MQHWQPMGKTLGIICVLVGLINGSATVLLLSVKVLFKLTISQ